MLTSSHVYWTWRLARGRPHAPVVALGAAAPDLPGIGLGAHGLARGLRGAALLRATYQRPGRERIHTCAHSVLVPLALALGSPSPGGRALAAGWAGHLAADLLTHHTDAWPPLYPLSRARPRSPVSYWERAHHAHAFSAVECLALGAAALTERRAGGRLAALAALALAALPLARRGVWAAHACVTPHGSPPRSPARGATVTR